jgi:hypothetical protein
MEQPLVKPSPPVALNGGLASETLRARLDRKRVIAQPEAPSLARFPDSALDPSAAHASSLAASYHAVSMRVLEPTIARVAGESGVDPALIAGIISRESGAGLLLDQSGLGDFGHGHGLMQIDDQSFGPWLESHDWKNPLVNIRKGVDILLDKKAEVTRLAKDRGLRPSAGDLLTWSVSAYNAGADHAIDGVIDHGRSDAYTTGGDYAGDVLARAAYYREHGYRV